MPYCGHCRQECEVNSYQDEEGDGVWAMQYTVVESVCCESEVFSDEECTKPYDPADDYEPYIPEEHT